jgi:hypothetical protein
VKCDPSGSLKKIPQLRKQIQDVAQTGKGSVQWQLGRVQAGNAKNMKDM